MVFQDWKSARASTLHVFFVWPTVNEQFLMNKLACTFGKVAFELFHAQTKKKLDVFSNGKMQKRVLLMFFVRPTVDEPFFYE